MIPKDARCQETKGMIGEDYIRCGKPAIMKIQHVGRDEGPYLMCLFCGTHNADNRRAIVLETNDKDMAERYNLEVSE